MGINVLKCKQANYFTNLIKSTKLNFCFFFPGLCSGMKQLTFSSAKQHFNLTSGTKWIKKIHCLWIGKGGGGVLLLCLRAINRQLIDWKLISMLWKTQKAMLTNRRGSGQTNTEQSFTG